MNIYIVIKEGKDGKIYAVCSFTNLKVAQKFVKIQNKISDEKYTIKTSLLLDTL